MNIENFAALVASMMAAQGALQDYQGSTEAIVEGERMPELIKAKEGAEKAVVEAIYQILYPSLKPEEDPKRKARAAGEWGPGYHLSTVAVEFNCPNCGHLYGPEFYQGKLWEKSWYVEKECKECQEPLVITEGIAGVEVTLKNSPKK